MVPPPFYVSYGGTDSCAATDPRYAMSGLDGTDDLRLPGKVGFYEES